MVQAARSAFGDEAQACRCYPSPDGEGWPPARSASGATAAGWGAPLVSAVRAFSASVLLRRRLGHAIASLFLVLWLALGAAAGAAPARPAGDVLLVDIKGAIGVAAARQISRAVDQARQEQAQAIVLRLDTPGGLVTSTRDIIREMVASPVPVIVYVAPSGARAASAGTFIVYAAHVAAMAPGTNLGAATPIEIGGLPGVPRPDDAQKDKGQSTASRKATNDAVAMLRSLAQMRGRNAEWAEKAVRDAATLTADEARKENVIDIFAASLDDLLAQADGRKVAAGGSERVLATRGARAVSVDPDWRTRLLGVISDPNIAFILLLIGVYGILFEFWSPGTYLPGVVGAISLILAMIALSTLPVQYGALALLLLGIALMIGEAFTPGFGALGIGGLVAFLVGSFFLFEPGAADIDIAVSIPLILGAAATTAGLAFFVLGAAVTARHRPPAIGPDELVGREGKVIDWRETSGRIRIVGEVWAARSNGPLQPDDTVRVVARDGLTLVVER
jgi:membrane-bound serine protease (ClpP class)